MSRTARQLLLFASLVGLDQLSKWWIERPDFHPFVVIAGFFNVIRAHNTGVAFSMFANLAYPWRTWLLLGITIGIACGVFLWWLKERHAAGLTSWLLVLILAGAAGNIWDRLHQGYVVDFIQWYVTIDGKAYTWPAFNIADSCITVGVVALLLANLKRR